MVEQTALELLQSGLENIARVIDAHGNCETGGGVDEDGEAEPVYDLEIARDYLEQAEALLEESSS